MNRPAAQWQTRNPLWKSVAWLVALLILVALWAALPLSPWANTPARQLQRVWQRAHQADLFRFQTEIVETISPLPLPGNVGMQSSQQFVRMSGTANLPQGSMFLTIQQAKNTVLDQVSGVQMKLENGKTYQRQNDQAAWEETGDFSAVFAPQGDLLAFLSAARDIRLSSAGEACLSPLTLDYQPEGALCYLFDVDGAKFANYMRDQLEQRLSDSGKLPPGVQLGASEAYRQMTGQGSLWLGADGLPSALVMDLEFPPNDNETVRARLTTSFLDYQFTSLSAANGVWALSQRLEKLDWRFLYNLAFLLALFFILAASLRSKRVYAALVIVLIVAMVIGPLLQQVQAGGFYRQMTAEQVAQRALQDQRSKEQQAQERLMQSQMDPNLSPLQQAQDDRQLWQMTQQLDDTQTGKMTPEQISAEQLAISEYLASMGDTNKDSDGDGLTDSQETILGSNPNNKDTDDDGVDDYKEVNGFVICNKTWYGDPSRSDTNLDGLNDSLEWNKDTDNDCTPDLWARDNDGDGVPDRNDISPQTFRNQTFTFSSPMTLKVENAQPGRIMYLEMQVRPSDPKQLQYSSIVLKWPTPDAKGQMTDFDGKTFKAANDNNTNDPRDAFGNIKIVPALQIEFENPDLAPPKSVYELYGAVLKDLKEGSRAKVMTVPLAPMEENNGRRFAFQAKAPLRSATSWGEPLRIRPMWLVVGLVDTCKADKWKDGVCTEVDKWNESNVLQIYPMSAVLTGLNLRENIGVDFGVVYPDANKFSSNPVEINKLDTLATLASALDKSFTAGRRNSNGQRDLTLDTVRERFDNTINSGVPISPTRFAINQNIFRVQLYKGFSHPDGASAVLAITETVKLLHTYDPLWSSNRPITPTLLFAQEDRFRAINLDTFEPPYSNVEWSGNQLSLNLSLQQGYFNNKFYSAIPEGLSAYMNWGSYLTNADKKWQPCTLQRFLSYIPSLYPLSELDPNAETARGMQIFMDLFYRSFYAGLGGVITLGGAPVPHFPETDLKIASLLKSLEGIKLPLKLFIQGIIILTLKLSEYKQLIATLGLFDAPNFRAYQMGSGGGLTPRQYRLWMEASWKIKVAGIAMLIAGLALLILKLFFENEGWAKITGIVIQGVLFVVFIVLQILTFIKYIKLAILIGWRYAVSYFPGGVKGCLWLTLAVSVLLFIYLVYQILSGNLSWGSVQFWTAVVYIIVTIVMMIAMIVIEMIPIVGPILILILTILSALAQIFHLRCDPISEIINVVVGVFYVANAIGVPDAKVEKTKMTLSNPDLGMQVGNNLRLQMQVNSADKGIDPESWQLWRFAEDWDWYRDGRSNLPRLTFKQNLSVKRKDVLTSDLDEQAKVWQDFSVDHRWEREGFKYRVHASIAKGSKGDEPSGSIPLTKAGVNRKLSPYFNYSYAAPARRCALSFICKIVQFDDKVASQIPNLYFDVFPESIEKFMAWNWLTGDPADLQTGEDEELSAPPTADGAPYPYPLDADGDGLMAQKYAGNDPDDAKWDTDGDTLSDYFEITTEQWAGGGALDPTKADSDNDGLDDASEIRYGANPRQADTDGDGLNDAQEVAGFDFTYDPQRGKKIRIFTNPNSRDTDRDGIMDNTEIRLHAINPSLYPYNAAVWNLNPMDVTVKMTNSPYPTGYVAAGWNGPLNFTRSVSDIGALMFKGKINSDIPKLSGHGGMADREFTMSPGDVFTQTFTVNGFNQFRGSERIDINTSACANLLNPLFIYPFDREPFLYNQLGSNYTPALQFPAYESLTVKKYTEPAPDTLGYSIGFARWIISGQVMGNGLLTNLESGYKGPFTLAGWVNPQLTAFPSPVQQVFALDNSAGRSMQVKFVRNSAPKPWKISFALGKPVNQEFTVPWSGPNDSQYGWVHLALVYDGKTTRFFVDGTPVGSLNGALENTGGRFYIGNLPGENGVSWAGLMDEIYYYNLAVNDLLIYRLAHPAAPTGEDEQSCEGDLAIQRNLLLWVDADNPTASITSLAADQYINARGVLVVGGVASDPTSPISKVEFQSDSGGWKLAGGLENWAYSWDTASQGEGYHTLAVRATDLVGHLASGASTRVVIDRQPPAADVRSVPATADRQDNAWYLHLFGTVSDPKAGSANGSGVASVEVKLTQTGLPDAGYQLADLNVANGTWSINYRLPLYQDLGLLPDPAGSYKITVRAADRAGNIADPANSRAETFTLLNPIARFDLGGESPMGQVISTTNVTFSGMVTDTSKTRRGINNAQLAFIPQQNMYVLDHSTALLHLDDPSNSNFFLDHSGKNNGASCWPPYCPTAREEGMFDKSALFQNGQYISIYPPLAEGAKAFTLSFWVWIQTYADFDNRLIAGQLNDANDRTPNAWWLAIESRNDMSLNMVDRDGKAHRVVVNNDGMRGKWLHVIASIWDEGGISTKIQLQVNMVENHDFFMGGYTYPSNLPIHLGSVPGGRYTKNWIDELVAFPFHLADYQMWDLHNWKNVKWRDVSLAQRGALNTKWSLKTPDDLAEEFYVVAARAQPKDSQEYGYLHFQPIWSGMIDLKAPVLDIQSGEQRSFCTAKDLNLAAESYRCWEQTASGSRWKYYHEVNEWYRNVTTDRTRLFELVSTLPIRRDITVVACDRFQHCASKKQFDLPAADLPWSLVSQVYSPTLITENLNPISLTTYAYAQDSLAGLQVSLDGSPYASTVWASPGVTETDWLTSWTPPAEGKYIFTSQATDFASRVQTTTFTSTVYVDLTPPDIVISTEVITLAHMTDAGEVKLQGVANDNLALMQVDADLDGGGWLPTALTTTNGADYAWELSYPLVSHDPPVHYADGQVLTVTARAFDAGWHVTQISRPVLLDVLPPEAVTLTVSFQDGASWLPLLPGATVRQPLDPNLRLEWGAASDGSGLRGYYAGFLEAGAPLDVGQLTAYAPLADRQHIQGATEAKAYFAYLAVEDIYGNLRWNTSGPFFADTPDTPDYISLTPVADSVPTGMPARQYGYPDTDWLEPDGIYRGWIDPQSSLLSVNRTAAERLPEIVGRSHPQSLALSWDAGGLRLNWSGADWDNDGDLLVFLNAQPDSGGLTAFNPYTDTLPLTVTLPARFSYVVHVADNADAALLAWNGMSWMEERQLDAEHFHYTSAMSGGLTDLYLPFGWLGIGDPSAAALDLLALAVDDPDLDQARLELWAAFPTDNPLNLQAMNGPAAPPTANLSINLVSLYHWDSLATGGLPSLGSYQDVDLRLAFESAPFGASSQQRFAGSAWAWPVEASTNGAPLNSGALIQYSAVVTNSGSVAAQAVRLELVSHGALILTGGQIVEDSDPLEYAQTIEIGDLAPAAARRVVWSGLVDVPYIQAQFEACLEQHPLDHSACDPYAQLRTQARLEGRLLLGDEQQADALSIRHLVDADPPSGVDVILPPGQENNVPLADLSADGARAGQVKRFDLAASVELAEASQRPPVYARPGEALVYGAASDPSLVRQVDLEVIDQDFNVSQATCSFPELVNNAWQCRLTTPQTDFFIVRAQATDSNGFTSPPSLWRMFILDANGPDLALEAPLENLFASGYLNHGLVLSGVLSDEFQASRVLVCVTQAEPLNFLKLYLPVVLAVTNGNVPAAPVSAPPALPEPEDVPVQVCQETTVTPDNAPTAAWWLTLNLPAGLDGARQTLTLTGFDAAGNASAAPIVRQLRLDTVAPQVSVQTFRAEINLAEYQAAPFALLSGLAQDGSGYVAVSATRYGPDGSLLEAVQQSGEWWLYTPNLTQAGVYQIVISAVDRAGNVTFAGAYELIVH